MGWIPLASLQPAIAQASAQYGVPADLLDGVIFTESGNGNASSPLVNTSADSGAAYGVAQFTPATAAALGVNPADPTSSINGAAKLLAQLYQQIGSWTAAAVGYNGGPSGLTASSAVSTTPGADPNYLSKVLANIAALGGSATSITGSSLTPAQTVALAQQTSVANIFKSGTDGSIFSALQAYIQSGGSLASANAAATTQQKTVAATYTSFGQWFQSLITSEGLTILIVGIGLLVLAYFLASGSSTSVTIAAPSPKAS